MLNGNTVIKECLMFPVAILLVTNAHYNESIYSGRFSDVTPVITLYLSTVSAYVIQDITVVLG